MEQITIDDFICVESPKKMICCSLTKNFHWLRITRGDTPAEFKENIDFSLRELDYLYVYTEIKDKIIDSFDGEISYVEFNWNGGAVI